MSRCSRDIVACRADLQKSRRYQSALVCFAFAVYAHTFFLNGFVER